MWADLRHLPATLRDALRLAVGLRPRSALPLPPGLYFWLLMVAALFALALDAWMVATPRIFDLNGLQSVATDGLLILAAAYLTAKLAGKTHLTWTLAVYWVLVLIVLLSTLFEWLGWQLIDQGSNRLMWYRVLLVTQVVLYVWCIGSAVIYLLGRLGLLRRMLLITAAATIIVAPWFVGLSSANFFYPNDEDTARYASRAPSYAAERTIYRQQRLLESAVRALAPERPGKTDLYWLAFAGDGTESVFRNEVTYFRELMDKRFDAANRGVLLVNSPATVERYPIASETALRAALRGIAGVMDKSEDLFVLFLTLHGTEDHQLYVNMPPLPLDPITPDSLAAVLRSSGIGPRVIIVSACYAGGFIPALSNDDSIVIAAARGDRASFGCGSESEITYFGRAYLVDSLNRSLDFVNAFEGAKQRVRSRELSEGFEPSEPQIAVGSKAHRRLRTWLEQYDEPEMVVPFFPADISDGP